MRERTMLDHVTLKFDPTASEHPDTAELFRHRTARTLYLLWRPGHLVGPGFAALALRVGKLIDQQKPRTAENLAACFPVAACREFSQGDVDRFCPEALLYFLGEKTVTYEVTKSA